MKRILIVDDDEEICEELAEILKEEGYFADKVFDGLEVNTLVEENNYDLILLDMKMPGINGIEILKNLKKSGTRAKILVISGSPIVTAVLSEGKDNDCTEEDKRILKLADSIMAKPFDVEILLNKIQELIG